MAPARKRAGVLVHRLAQVRLGVFLRLIRVLR